MAFSCFFFFFLRGTSLCCLNESNPPSVSFLATWQHGKKTNWWLAMLITYLDLMLCTHTPAGWLKGFIKHSRSKVRGPPSWSVLWYPQHSLIMMRYRRRCGMGHQNLGLAWPSVSLARELKLKETGCSRYAVENEHNILKTPHSLLLLFLSFFFFFFTCCLSVSHRSHPCLHRQPTSLKQQQAATR